MLFILAIYFLLYPTNVSAHDSIPSIHMTQNGFEPSSLKVRVGETVEFENLDVNNRWPASNIHPTHEAYPEFDPQKEISPGSTWQITFEKPGTWQFHDHLYPQFTGEIQVEGQSVQKDTNFSIRIKESISTLSLNTKVFFYKTYFQLFPKQARKQLDNLQLSQLDRNNKDISFWLSVFGSKKLMTTLLTETGGGSQTDCHNQAHILGRLSYEIFRSQAFSNGSADCHSGFYHGAMEAFLKENGNQNLAESIDQICNSFPTSFGKFECLHGVGHGVMANTSYNLTQAIEACKSLKDQFARSSCFGGVFMENIVAALGNPFQDGHKTEWISEDPQYPCNAIDQSIEVQEQCYLMQTSRMYQILNTTQAVSNECSKASENIKSTCFQSLGRDISGRTLRKAKDIIAECSFVPDEYRDNCINGALNVIVDFWGNKMTNQPAELCNLLDDHRQAKSCANTLSGRIVNVFGNDETKVIEVCSYLKSDKEFCVGQAKLYF